MSSLTVGALQEWCANASPSELSEYNQIITSKREEIFQRGKERLAGVMLEFAEENRLEATPEEMRELLPSGFDVAQLLMEKRKEE